MKKLLIATLCLFTTVDILAQVEPNRKIKFSLIGGITRSTFVYDRHTPSAITFPTTELRIGMGVTKPIVKNLELKSALILGLKIKRRPYFENSNYYLGGMLGMLDETVSNHHHLFFEIPLVLQYNFSKTVFGMPNFVGLRLGVNYRLFFRHSPNDFRYSADDDLLNGTKELGVLIGCNFNITKKISVALEYGIGITKIGDMFVYDANRNLSYNSYARNNFIQLKMEYRLKK